MTYRPQRVANLTAGLSPFFFYDLPTEASSNRESEGPETIAFLQQVCSCHLVSSMSEHSS